MTDHLALFGALVFACGAFYEASCVGFVVFANDGKAWKTALASGLAGAAEVTGIFGTVRDWHIGPFFVVGLMTGAYLGVSMRGRTRTKGER
jgi:hypothetical protein